MHEGFLIQSPISCHKRTRTTREERQCARGSRLAGEIYRRWSRILRPARGGKLNSDVQYNPLGEKNPTEVLR